MIRRLGLAALLLGTSFSLAAYADAASCPAKVTCPALKTQLVAHRRELDALKRRVESSEDKGHEDDEAAIEKRLDEVEALSACTHCDKALRSEAYAISAGLGGILAEHFDHFGIKKGEHGRAAFTACKEAARVDPSSVVAWTNYGKALVKISNKRMKSRIASFLKIDLRAEITSTIAKLKQLPSDGVATATIRELESALQRVE